MNIYIHHDGRRYGPLTIDDVNEKALRGEVDAVDPAWMEGWTEWQTVAVIPGYIPLPPPLPVSVESEEEDGEEVMYFYIPVVRHALLSIATIGLFEVYWFYRNWNYIKYRHHLNIMPFWRAFFSIIFAFPLLWTIRKDPVANAITPARFSAAGLVAVWIAAMFLCSRLSPASHESLQELLREPPDPNFLLIGFLRGASSFLCFLPVQLYINRLNRSLVHPPKYFPWSIGQVALLAIGAIVWIGAIGTILFPAIPPPIQ